MSVKDLPRAFRRPGNALSGKHLLAWTLVLILSVQVFGRGDSTRSPRVIEAESFVLKGPDGQTRGQFLVDAEGKARLKLSDPQGRPRLTLTCSEKSVTIAIRDQNDSDRLVVGEFEDGRPALVVFPPRVRGDEPSLVVGQDAKGTSTAVAFADAGRQRLTLGLFEDGRAGLDLQNPDQSGQIQMSVRPDDVSQFSIRGARQKAGLSLNAYPDGSSGLLLRDANGMQRISQAIHSDGRADSILRGKKQNEQVSLVVMPDGRSAIQVQDTTGQGAVRLESWPSGSLFLAMEGQPKVAPFLALGRVGVESPGMILRGKDGKPSFLAPQALQRALEGLGKDAPARKAASGELRDDGHEKEGKN